MLYFYYGKDNLRKKRAIKKLLDDNFKFGTLERLDVDLKEGEEEYKKVIDFVSQQSIFGGKKIVVVENALFSSEKKWINFLKENIFSSHFIILSSDEKPQKEFSFLLQKEVLNFEFDELEGEALRKFIKEEAKENGIELTKEALDFLFSYLSSLEGERSWVVFGELKKAAFLGKKTISKKDLEEISLFPQFDKVWTLTKKILESKKIDDKLSALEKLIASGTDYYYVFNSLAFNASFKHLEKLAQLDIALKSGKMDIKEAILLFVLES